MIYSVKTTKEGLTTVSQWAGDNSGSLNFLEATILASAAGGMGIGELSRVVNESYTFPIASDHIVSKLFALEKRGLVSVMREIESHTKLVIYCGAYTFRTTFAEFAADNLKLHEIADAKRDLLFSGAFGKGKLGEPGIVVRLA